METIHPTQSFAAGIVTYNPDIERLRENISSIKDNACLRFVIIADNGSNNVTEIQSLVVLMDGILFLPLGENKGIAFALNTICQKALSLQIDWLMTLDQDSVSQAHIIDDMAALCHQGIGIICPRIEDRNMGRRYTNRSEGTDYIERCVTSGSLVCLKAWEETKGFSEQLFIDGVDYDFCQKLRNAGYKILRNNAVFIIHEIGHGQTRQLFGKNFAVMNHAPIRLYYMIRNYLYLGQYHHQKWYWTKEVVKRIGIVILYERNRLEKLKYIISGIHDYHRGITGKYKR